MRFGIIILHPCSYNIYWFCKNRCSERHVPNDVYGIFRRIFQILHRFVLNSVMNVSAKIRYVTLLSLKSGALTSQLYFEVIRDFLPLIATLTS